MLWLYADGFCGWSKSSFENDGDELHWDEKVFVLPGICSLLWEDKEIWCRREDLPFRCAEVRSSILFCNLGNIVSWDHNTLCIWHMFTLFDPLPNSVIVLCCLVQVLWNYIVQSLNFEGFIFFLFYFFDDELLKNTKLLISILVSFSVFHGQVSFIYC